MRTTLIFFAIAIISILATHLLHMVTKKNRFIKYIPSIVLLILTAYNIVVARFGPSNGFEDLGRFVLALFTFTAGISSILYLVFIDIIFPRLRRRT
jgi:hypothetical protein